MTPYNDILKLNSEGMSTRAIERAVGVSRKTVITVLHLAELYDLTYPLDTPMTDTQIHRLLHPKKESERLRPNMEAVIFELSMPDTTVVQAWNEYASECQNIGKKAYSLSMFQNYVNEAKQQYNAPEYRSVMVVRYVRDVIRPDGKSAIGLLICKLIGSGYITLIPVANKAPRTFVHALTQLMKFIGGVPEYCVLQGRLSGLLHDIAEDFFTYHGTYLADIQELKFSSKETSNIVSEVQNSITSQFDEQAVYAIETAYNNRPFFESGAFTIADAHNVEKRHMFHLPVEEYNLHESVDVSVQINFHVQIDGMYYSVPFEYRHCQLEAIVSNDLVEICYGGDPVCTHKKLRGRLGQYSTDPAHLPDDKDIPRGEVSGTSLREWAAKVGPSTLKVIDRWLTQKPYEALSYKTCNALLHMTTTAGNEAVESACKSALDINKTAYSYITAYLKLHYANKKAK